MNPLPQRPSNAFIGAAWAALAVGSVGFLIGLWNASMLLSEKGYYFAVLMFGLFSAVSVQKKCARPIAGHPGDADLFRIVLDSGDPGDCAVGGRVMECDAQLERKGVLRDGVCAQHVCGDYGAEEYA